MNELIEYIEELLKNPNDFDLNRTNHEAHLLRLLHRFADERPPTIEQMIEALKQDFPGLESNYELLQKGKELRDKMMERVFAEDFEVDEVKSFEGQMSLFDKLIGFNSTINSLLENVSGAKTIRKSRSSKGKTNVEVVDHHGTAQKLLLDREKNG